MRILRVGGVNPQTSRFLDLLLRNDVEKIDFYINENEISYFDDLYNVAEFFNIQYLMDKIDIYSYSLNPIRKIIGKGLRILNKLKIKNIEYYKYQNLKELKRNKYNVIWVGDNDFDGSNDLFVAVREIFKDEFIIRSYKETRFFKKYSEYEMLKKANMLIFPNYGYINFFSNLYNNIKIKNYIIADIDWRFSKTLEWINDIKTEKFSTKDNNIHCCILTGRALSDPSEERSGDRYYFIPFIKEICRFGIKVHLHANKIIPKKGEKLSEYHLLEKANNNFFIEKPLKLMAGSDDYKILKSYDIGLLHPKTRKENISLYEFQKINIPNRLFEYQACDVIPLLPNNEMIECKKMICKTGIIFDNYDEIRKKTLEFINRGNIYHPNIHSYKDLCDAIFDKI